MAGNGTEPEQGDGCTQLRSRFSACAQACGFRFPEFNADLLVKPFCAAPHPNSSRPCAPRIKRTLVGAPPRPAHLPITLPTHQQATCSGTLPWGHTPGFLFPRPQPSEVPRLCWQALPPALLWRTPPQRAAHSPAPECFN